MRVKCDGREMASAVATFVIALAVFIGSPVRQYADSYYSLLVSESLLRHGTSRLDRFFPLPLDSKRHPGLVPDRWREENRWPPGLPSQLEITGGSLRYRYPLGSSLLSLPFVAVLRVLGVFSVGPDGQYDAAGEQRQQVVIATLLMAAFTTLCYLTARLALPRALSFAVAGGAALGTPVWSTASRGLWSHTWGLLLIGLVVHQVLRAEITGRSRRPILLATLLAWAFLVRPVHAISALAVTGLVASRDRRAARRLVVTGALWFGAFVCWNLATRGAFLPWAYAGHGLTTRAFGSAWAGHLLSPSRGLLVFSPFIAVLLALAFRARRGRRVLGASVVVTVLHFIPLSLLPTWWGGHCYGPRLATDLVPWFVSWAVLALGLGPRLSRLARALLVVSLVWSVTVHGRGALSSATWHWNGHPWNVDRDPSRVWDWSDAQFLAGLTGTAAPGEEAVIPVGSRIALASRPDILRQGWHRTGSLAEIRGRRGVVLFRTDRARPGVAWRLRIGLASAPSSPVLVRLDGRPIGVLPVQREPALHIGVMELPEAAGLAFERTGGGPLHLEWMELAIEPQRPPHGRPIAVGTNEAEPYLGAGWSWGEGRFRWTVGGRADVRFRWNAGQPACLVLRAHPFAVGGHLFAERVSVVLNGRPITVWTFDGPVTQEKTADLPGSALRDENQLSLFLPRVVSPRDAGAGSDGRPLGLAVETLGLHEPWDRLRSAP